MKDIVELGDVPLKLFELEEAKCPLGLGWGEQLCERSE